MVLALVLVLVLVLVVEGSSSWPLTLAFGLDGQVDATGHHQSPGTQYEDQQGHLDPRGVTLSACTSTVHIPFCTRDALEAVIV